ncbi:hypothetical protein FCI59_12665 [Pseudomonas protegens]|uniref:MAC/perforin domain-containing protein n=1 Tax=Pseudomonas TaxID=286 RepID=UPI0015750259|nr:MULTISPECIES: MAC/perforin domain-containing protein [Pseudomonas]MDF4206488.1 MAC/perforin domain-containing protein [Pseudomonas protegens]NTZ72173.1 hypothetical protein [Pseudomonas protegens]UZE32525.1 MAC/perforin domain-containing protein [Pseudomonas sp. B21-059]
MATTLVLVERTDGQRRNVALDLNASLTATREVLTSKELMTSADDFLLRGAPVDRDDEDDVHLSALVGADGSGTLMIGVASTGLEDPDKTVDRYNHLTTSQKLALFNEIEIYRGITAAEDKGFYRTFKPCIASWNANQLPASTKPTYMSENRVISTFSEVGNTLALTTSDKSSVSVTTPIGGGQTDFSYAQSHTTTSKKVKQYLLGKYMVNKVALSQERANLVLVSDFESAIATAISPSYEIDAYVNLIETLNSRGYYVARTFTLGGMLVSEENAEVSEYTESRSEEKEFSVGFKLAIKGFGGGSDYTHSEGHEESESNISKYENTSLTKIGGSVTANTYDAWTESLKPAINWDVIDHMELYPTLALLRDMRVARRCLKLMDEYHTYDTVRNRQTVIDIGKYTTRVQQILFTNG